MRPRTLLVALSLAALTLGAACTSDTTDSTASSVAPSPPTTSDVNATIVPGEWTYEYLGVKATFEWKDGPPILTVKNASGEGIQIALEVSCGDQKVLGMPKAVLSA